MAGRPGQQQPGPTRAGRGGGGDIAKRHGGRTGSEHPDAVATHAAYAFAAGKAVVQGAGSCAAGAVDLDIAITDGRGGRVGEAVAVLLLILLLLLLLLLILMVLLLLLILIVLVVLVVRVIQVQRTRVDSPRRR